MLFDAFRNLLGGILGFHRFIMHGGSFMISLRSMNCRRRNLLQPFNSIIAILSFTIIEAAAIRIWAGSNFL